MSCHTILSAVLILAAIVLGGLGGDGSGGECAQAGMSECRRKRGWRSADERVRRLVHKCACAWEYHWNAGAEAFLRSHRPTYCMAASLGSTTAALICERVDSHTSMMTMLVMISGFAQPTDMLAPWPFVKRVARLEESTILFFGPPMPAGQGEVSHWLAGKGVLTSPKPKHERTRHGKRGPDTEWELESSLACTAPRYLE